MIEDPTVTILRAFRMEAALGKVISLSTQQARETWRGMKFIVTKGSSDGLPGSLIQTAIEFNQYPPAWKVVADKALSANMRELT